MTKTSIFFVILLSIVTGKTPAQVTPEALLSQLPSVPTVNCATDTAEINRFMGQIYKVKEMLNQEVDRIHSDAQSNMDQSKDKILSNVIRQLDLNKSDVQKLQQSGGNEELERKVAEKAVAKQHGVSLQELEKVSEMSGAGQEKWAQQYAAQMMDEAKKNPEATIKKENKTKHLIELEEEKKALGERITEKMERIALLYRNVEQQDSIETHELEEKLRPLREQEQMMYNEICSDAEIARSKAAKKQIYALKIKYCEKMSPLQIDAISQSLSIIKSLFPDYRKFTDVQNEIFKLQQTGIIISADLSCYDAVDKYASALSGAYKYWVGKF